MKLRSGALLALAGALVAERAQAAPQASGLAPGPFDPAPAGDRFFASSDASVNGILDPHASLLFDYAYRPLRRYDTDYPEPVTRQLYAHASVSAALAEAVLLNLDLPFLLAQSGDQGGDRTGALAGGVFGDLRISLRGNITGTRDDLFSVGLQVDTWAPTGSPSGFTGDGSFRTLPKIVGSGRAGVLAYALGAGYMFRPTVDVGTIASGSSLVLSGAIGSNLHHDTLFFGVETYGQTATRSFFDANASPWETLVGTKFRAGNFVFGLAAGGSTLHPSETLRSVVSLTWTPDRRVFDRDGDGLVDDRDRCPDVPSLEPSGCPSADRDGDSIPDDVDACPDVPGLVHVDPAKRGCPADQRPAFDKGTPITTKPEPAAPR